jgi:transcriptional activator of cad operon
MADDPRRAPGAEPPQTPVERLESWKEIAAYLRRDVRTVQRWEQADGLPVHRHKRAHRPIPYAYKAELDAWWTSRSESASPAAIPEPPGDVASSHRRTFIAAASAVLVVVAAAGVYWNIRQHRSTAPTAAERASHGSASPAAPVTQKSIAVLPFLDLTEGMKNEEFADGMTEELIDRLNKIPGLRVPAPTSTFYFKNKRVPLSEIAKALDVAYVLDGSVRKAGGRVRVAVRLIRADNADVVWSESYDRPWSDILTTQDDIAGDVTTALRTSIDARPGNGGHGQ